MKTIKTDTEDIYYKALDEMLVVSCIGTADNCKTVEDVMKKIDLLIDWNISVHDYFKGLDKQEDATSSKAD